MSDTLQGLLARPMGIDYLTPLKGWQDLAHSQAQTSLLGQQAQGAAIGNQLAGLNLAKTGWIYDAAGIPHPALVPPGGAMPAPNGYLPGMQGANPSAIIGASSSTPAPFGSAPTTNGASSSSYPGQLAMEKLGQPMPPMLAVQVMTATDPAAALKAANETRRQTVFSTISGASPDGYVEAMHQLYRVGYVTPQMLKDATDHPEGRARILAATQSPESYQTALTTAHGQGLQPNANSGQPEVSAPAIAAKGAAAEVTAGGASRGELPLAGALAGARAGAARSATAPFDDPYEMTVPDGNGNLVTKYVPRPDVPALSSNGARRTTGADLSNPGVAVSPEVYAGRVMTAESGNNPGAGNPRLPGGAAASSASGGAQFLAPTFVPIARALRPELTRNMSDDQVAALRNDTTPAGRALQREATIENGRQNATALAAAGQPVTAMTVGLAHRFGAAGAMGVLNAPANTPLDKLVPPEVMTANPDLRGKTAGDALATAFKSYGVGAVTFPAPGAAPAAGAGPAAPVIQGAITGKPALTQPATAGMGVATKQIEADQTAVTASLAGAQAAQQQQTNLTQMRNLGGQINSGSFGEMRQGFQNYLATFAPEFGQRFVNALSAGKIDPSKASSTQEFVKIALQTAGQAEKANNPQGGLGITQVYQSAYPNLETQPAAIREMSNLFLVNQQRIIDHAQAQQAFQSAQQRDAVADPRSYKPLNKFEAEFLKSNSPLVYVGAAAALNGKPFADWSRGMTTAQQAEALRVMWRSDPAAVVMKPDGTWVGNPTTASQ